VCAGGNASFSVTASGAGLTYQWWKNGSPLAGQAGSSLSLNNVSSADAGSYSVTVSGTCGNTVSSGATLTVNQSVAVSSGPVSLTNCPGSSASFSVSATGTGLSYQWYKAGQALTNQSGSSLVLSSVSGLDSGIYSVVVSGVCGGPLTNSASLSVGCPFRILSIATANGVATIIWSSTVGQTYRLQYKNTLTETNWHDVSPDLLASEPTTTATNLLGNATQRFYRVMRVVPGLLLMQPQPNLRISSLTVTSGVATIRWSSVSGKTYRLQYAPDLWASDWQDVQPDVTANASTAMATNLVGTASRRFYRVMLVP
jgi:hypothetical protein